MLAVGVMVGIPSGCQVPALSVANLALVALAALAWVLAVFLAPGLRRWGSWEHVAFQRRRLPSWQCRDCDVRQPRGLARWRF